MARRTSRIPRAPTASRWGRRRSSWPSALTAGPRTRNFLCRKACTNISRGNSAPAGRSSGRNGWASSSATAAPIPTSPISASGCSGAISPRLPWLLGGAADLAPSTKTRLTFKEAGDFESDDYGGRNLHFGIREHAMGSICNGLSLSKLRPFGSGFLIFSDYMKPPIRLGAIMELPVVYVFTHDSIGVGEDGPTHQPVEQLAALRSIPGLIVLRPADANEVVEAWRVA